MAHLLRHQLLLKSWTSPDLFSQATKYFKISIQCGVFGLAVPVTLWSGDVYTDSRLCKGYFNDWQNQTSGTTILNTTLEYYPEELSDKAKFFYSLFFVLIPLVLQTGPVLEWARARWTKDNQEKKSTFLTRTKIIASVPLMIFFWPAFQMMKSFWQQVLAILARGHDRQKMNRKAIQCEINRSYAHLIEVVVESTFQPLLQWYVVFPGVYAMIQDDVQNDDASLSERFRESFLNERSFKNSLEFSSWLLSVFSLAWSFTGYYSALKRGAMSLDVNPIGKGLLFLSNLCLVFVRMNFIIFLMYSWGPGQFYPGILVIVGHVILMGLLHVLFANHDRNPFSSDISCITRVLTIIYSLTVNGLANIYCHNFVDTEQKQGSETSSHKRPTFARQLTFETIFLLENITIAIIACLSIPVRPFDDFHECSQLFAVLLGIHGIGLALKMIYYKFFHIWKDITTRFEFQTGSLYRVDKKVDFGCTSCC